jgi:NAD(P)-dependent dehydrogenase (short-subunit alcohol dehydrogenase family)
MAESVRLYNPMDLTGRRFLVTGAASGIGRATSVLLSRLGAKLVCTDVDEPGLRETGSLLDSDGHSLQVRDLKETDAVAGWLADIANTFGPLHGFVHAAGIPARLPLQSLSIAKWREVFLINTEAALVISKAFCSRRIYAGNSGSIVFISSVMAQAGSPAAAAYSLSKAALDGMARSMAIELAGRRIRVNCVAPGFVRTPMFEKMQNSWDTDERNRVEALHPLGIGRPEDISNAVAFLLADTSCWITGTVLVVDGGYLAQ